MKVKNQKRYKTCVIKRILKSKDYKIFLQASQFKNKIKYQEKKKIDIKLNKITTKI